MPAQMKAYCDSTCELWVNNDFGEKMAGTFSSTATQHRGKKTSAFTFATFIAHLRMTMLTNDRVRGGSPYGAGTITLEDELKLARHNGALFGKAVVNFYPS